MTTYLRTWALDDIVIRSGGDGRTVEAYAAMFDAPYEVRDQHGHYMETIDRAAFNRTLGHGIHKVACLYNHGLTVHGTPDMLGSVPLGTPVEIRPDGRGLRTVTRYNKSELADAVLEAIRNGDIRSQSFRGRVFRSSPQRVPRVMRGAALPTVVRHELGLDDYGPTPLPVNGGAEILLVRSADQLAAELADLDDEEREALLGELSRHLPGKHRQAKHGNRFNSPGDRSSGLRRKGVSKFDPSDEDEREDDAGALAPQQASGPADETASAGSGTVRGVDLKPGDRITRLDPVTGRDTPVTVLREPEPTTDQFGRSEWRVWARREDTGKEGYINFGDGGVFRRDTTDSEAALVDPAEQWTAVSGRIQGAGDINAQARQLETELGNPGLLPETRTKLEKIKARNIDRIAAAARLADPASAADPVQGRVDRIVAQGRFATDTEDILKGASRDELVAIGQRFGVQVDDLKTHRLAFARIELTNRIRDKRNAQLRSPSAQAEAAREAAPSTPAPAAAADVPTIKLRLDQIGGRLGTRPRDARLASAIKSLRDEVSAPGFNAEAADPKSLMQKLRDIEQEIGKRRRDSQMISVFHSLRDEIESLEIAKRSRSHTVDLFDDDFPTPDAGLGLFTATPADAGLGAEDPPTTGHSGRLAIRRARLRMEMIQRGLRDGKAHIGGDRR